ncbi:hypothetical protein JAU75_08720 [Ochrobactrum sp. Q0168]|uniref:DUF6492 family protein n=1 Tax=Ochrobactrum sp. Q0168 TaxID=2793241 RepID=UPI0018EE0CD6|nr:hypothetical protein [Ochrobactrum sp. Q0168]
MKTALITASYHKDFERCKLLCETVDRHVSGFTNHYILVEPRDVALFRQLAGPRRVIIDERELLPSWLRVFPDPTSFGKRRIWLSTKTKPLRGWHVQQLRRIAVAQVLEEDSFLYMDSDTIFLRPFDCDSLWHGERLRLFVRPNALADPKWTEHPFWSANAAKILGIPETKTSLNDYVGQLIAWRRDTMLSMCERIEQQTGRHWVAGIGMNRRFSECFIYGRYVEDVLNGAGHFTDTHDLCRVMWFEPPPTEAEFRAFITEMEPYQVAICMQSFLGLSADDIRRITSG